MKPGRTLSNITEELRAQGAYLHHLIGANRELAELPAIARKLRSLATEIDKTYKARIDELTRQGE